MKNKKNILNYLFYVAYFMFLAFSMAGHIDFLKPYFNVATYISLGLILIIILFNINLYKKREFLIFSIFLVFSLFIGYKNNDFSLLKIFLILMAMLKIDFDYCISADFKARMFLILIILGLCLGGYSVDVISYNDGLIKHSLGFLNPNALGMHTLILVFEILYLSKEKLSFKKIIISLLILFFVNYYAGCRTANIIIVITSFMFLIFKININFFNKKYIKFFITNSVLICFILTLFSYLLYKNDTNIGNFLNDALSNRLFNIDIYYHFYNINIFGHNIEEIALTLDNAYAYSLFGIGISGVILFIYSFKKLFIKLYEEKNYSLIIIIFSFVIYGLSERLWLQIDYNIFMACFVKILFCDKSLKNR